MSERTIIIQASILDAALEEAQEGTVQIELEDSTGEVFTLIIVNDVE